MKKLLIYLLIIFAASIVKGQPFFLTPPNGISKDFRTILDTTQSIWRFTVLPNTKIGIRSTWNGQWANPDSIEYLPGATVTLKLFDDSLRVFANSAASSAFTNKQIGIGTAAVSDRSIKTALAIESLQGLLANGIYVSRGSGSFVTNTVVGNIALANNTTGEYNSAFGLRSLLNNTTGSHNTSYGFQTMQGNTIGSGNTAIGDGAIINNTSGNNNSMYGWQAGNELKTGSNNIGIGYNAMRGIYYGSNNIHIGSTITPDSFLSNSINIGNRLLMDAAGITRFPGLAGVNNTDSAAGFAADGTLIKFLKSSGGTSFTTDSTSTEIPIYNRNGVLSARLNINGQVNGLHTVPRVNNLLIDVQGLDSVSKNRVVKVLPITNGFQVVYPDSSSNFVLGGGSGGSSFNNSVTAGYVPRSQSATSQVNSAIYQDTATGRIGVRKTNPGSQLDVSGSIRATSGSLLVSNSDGTRDSTQFATFEAGADETNSSTGAAYITSTEPGKRIFFGKQGKTVYSLNFSNVSIFENTPKININDMFFGANTEGYAVGRDGNRVTYTATGNSGSGHAFYVNTAGNTSSPALGGTGNLEALTILNSGFTGINQTTPATRLHVGGAVTYDTQATPADPVSGKTVQWFDGTNMKWKKNVGGTVTTGTLY